MPKIPVYQQQVSTATGSLSPRADAGAFTAPGQALAQFGDTVTQIADNFVKEERKARLEAKSMELNTQYINESDDLLRNAKATTTEEFDNGFDAFNKEFNLRIDNDLSLSKADRRVVMSNLNKFRVQRGLEGRRQSFARGRDEASKIHNSYIKQIIGRIKSTPLDDPLRKVLNDELTKTYIKAQEKGETRFIESDINSITKATSDIQINDTFSIINSVDNMADVKKAATQAQNFLTDEKDIFNFNKLLDAKKNEFIDEKATKISTAIFQSKEEYTQDKIAQIRKTLQEGKEINIDGKVFNLSGFDGDDLRKFDARFNTELSVQSNEIFRNASQALSANIQNKSGIELKNLMDNFSQQKDGKYINFPEITDLSQRSILEGILTDEFDERKPKLQATLGQKQAKLNALQITNDGVLDDEAIQLQSDINAIYDSLEKIDEKNKYNNKLNSTSEAYSIFNPNEFKSKKSKEKLLLQLSKKFQETADPKDLMVLTKFQELLNSSNEKIENNFVAYYMQKNNLTEPPPLDELVAIQERMGVENIRVATNAQLDEFQNAYNQAERATDKKQVADNFFSNYVGFQGLLMKNLVQENKITQHDMVIIANADVPGIEAVSAAYLPETQKNLNDSSFFSTNDNREFLSATNAILSEYRESVLGADSVDAGFTSGRQSHILSMRNVIMDTAKSLTLSSELSVEDSVEKAYEIVIGNKNEFSVVNGKQVRFPKSQAGNQKDNMAEVLGSFVSPQNINFLKEKIEPVPPQGGFETLTDAEVEIYKNTYINDLVNQGSWRTTVDGTGLFLVDATGNLVRKKTTDAIGPLEGELSYITIKFEDLRDIESKILEAQRQNQFGNIVMRDGLKTGGPANRNKFLINFINEIY